MLMPKRTKYRKQFRGKRRGMAMSGNSVAFGEFGLQSLDNAWVDARQIEAARRVIVQTLQRGGKVWIRVFPDKPVSAKPVEVRMGKGKGATDRWVAVVKRGKVMFEIAGVDESIAREAFRKAHHKLPVKTKFIAREEEF
ncbi:MAG: 50S ribosomal protein L16 [Dehalococcoidia bacterium]|nr:50S ribosomal protein L16 [Dehalococcoidia bacterium]